MPIYVNVGGVWKDVLAPSANVGGVWKDGESATDGVQDLYANVGGTWHMVWPMKLSLPGITAWSEKSSGTTSAWIDIRSDGSVRGHGDGTSASNVYQYYAENFPDTDKDVAASPIFQFRWRSGGGLGDPDSFVLGTAGASVPVNTWTDINPVSFGVAARATVTKTGSGDNEASFLLDIRAKHATGSEITALSPMNLSATIGAPL